MRIPADIFMLRGPRQGMGVSRKRLNPISDSFNNGPVLETDMGT